MFGVRQLGLCTRVTCLLAAVPVLSISRPASAQSGPLPPPQNPPQLKAINGSLLAGASFDLRILVISADGTEADLPAIKQALDYQGTPYDVYIAAPGGVPSGGLAPDQPLTSPSWCSKLQKSSIYGRYQGIILTTGDLVYFNGSGWYSALKQTEWQTLWTYETNFGVRQVSWYTNPAPDYGFNLPDAWMDTTGTTTATFPTAGQTIFSYLNTANPVQIQNAWTYLAMPLTGSTTTTTTPVLQDGAGHALAAVCTYLNQGNRQNLAFTFDSNPNLVHDLELAYGAVNWVTGGMFLGKHRVYLSAQVDDLFIDDDMWWYPAGTCPTVITATDRTSLAVEGTGVIYRITGTDLQALIAWQKAKQAQLSTQQFRLDLAFNGYGTTSAYWTNYLAWPSAGVTYDTPGGVLTSTTDTLTPAAKANQSLFNWISHTYDHEDLDTVSYSFAKSEIQKNNQVASQLGLTNYKKLNMVSPGYSGLKNQYFLQAAYDSGMSYLVCDTSIYPFNNPLQSWGTTAPTFTPSSPPPPNTGIYDNFLSSTGVPESIFLIPRHPVNLFFNVSTPDEWVNEYNCMYGVGGTIQPPASDPTAWGTTNYTYPQLLDKVSQDLLFYLLKGDMDPWMFHQPNLRAYDGSHALLGNLLDATLARYNALFNLPVVSPTMDVLGGQMVSNTQNLAANLGAGLTANLQPGKSLTLTNNTKQNLTVPVTGVKYKNMELYGGQYTSYISVNAGQSITFALQ